MANTFDAFLDKFDANGPSSADIVEAVEKYFVETGQSRTFITEL